MATGEKPKRGQLLLIGGAERRSEDSEILRHFVKEAGGEKARILVCAAATREPQRALPQYKKAFEELGAGPDLIRLASLQGSGSGGSLLTGRELEVLRILAAGATNRSIGEQLAISERTVDRHVSNIFDKLGVTSRTEAAASAVRKGLV